MVWNPKCLTLKHSFILKYQNVLGPTEGGEWDYLSMISPSSPARHRRWSWNELLKVVVCCMCGRVTSVKWIHVRLSPPISRLLLARSTVQTASVYVLQSVFTHLLVLMFNIHLSFIAPYNPVLKWRAWSLLLLGQTKDPNLDLWMSVSELNDFSVDAALDFTVSPPTGQML